MKTLLWLQDTKFGDVPVDTTFLRADGQLCQKSTPTHYVEMQMQWDGKLIGKGSGKPLKTSVTVGTFH